MIHIKHRFTSLNKYTNANRTHYHKGAKIKKSDTEVVFWHARGIKIPTPCKFIFTWHYKKTRGKLEDPDNIAFQKKFVLDGLMRAGAIPEDTHEHIKGFEDRFVLSDYFGVTIEWEKME